MNFKRPYPTDIGEIEMLELTLESPSPVHGIPYKDIDIRGWIYWVAHWEAWAYVAEMDSDIGITCRYLYGRSFFDTTYDQCLKNPARPRKSCREFELWYISIVNEVLNGVRLPAAGLGKHPTAEFCAFA